MLGIPPLVLLEGRTLAQLSLCLGHIAERERLALQHLAFVCLFDVFEQNPPRSAVADDVMDVLQQVEVLGIPEQTDAEQAFLQQVEGLHEPCLLRLDVGHILHDQPERLILVDGLHRVALGSQFYACEQRGMGSHSRLHSPAQPLAVQAAVQRI